MINRIVVYGLLGLFMEVLWTGLGSFFKGDKSLKSTTSLLMFFIYGLAVFLEPLFIIFAPLPPVFRGSIYMVIIFCGEYVTGYLMERRKICPWNYGNGVGSVYGLIYLYYAPVWFVVGIFYEFVYWHIFA